MHSEKAIEYETGYSIGNLYTIGDNATIDDNTVLKKIDKQLEEIELYDCTTKNYHIVPKKNDDSEDIFKKIKTVREILVGLVKKEIKEGEEFNEGTGKKGGKGQLKFERYIQIKTDNTQYLLCFERMYRHKGKIHNLLGAFQFYKFIGKGVNRGHSGKLDMCYPSSLKNGKSCSNMIGNVVKNSEFEYTINECCKDDEKCKELVDEFLDFLRKDRNHA